MTKINTEELAEKFNDAVQKMDTMKRIQFCMSWFRHYASNTRKLFIATEQGSPEVGLAEITADIAERTGKSEEFKKFVPAEAHTEEARKALAKKAPTFAKLCA
jgi:hypothetical protein